MAMKYGLISTVAASVAAGAMAAQWTGAGSTTEWSNPDNWENGTVGSADVRIEAAKVTGSKIITFDAPYTFTDIFHIYAGTAEDPVIFRATGENGLAAQNNKEMYVGSGAANSGYLVLDGGFYLFKNDLKPGWNQSEGTVVVKSGTKVDVDYWILIGDGSGGTGTGRLVVDGGDVYCGRKETSNGAITIGRGKGSKGELIVSGGSFRSSERSGEPALRVADGENSIGNMLVSGGTVQSDGEADIGYGNGSTATATMRGGTWNVTGRLYVGRSGRTANGTLTLDGGTINASQDFRIGDKSSTGKVIQNGGEISVGINYALGAEENGTGTYEMKGGVLKTLGTGNNDGCFYISRYKGTGRFTLTDGEVKAIYYTYVGSKNSTGWLTVNGGRYEAQQPIVPGSEGGVGHIEQNGGEVAIVQSPLQFNTATAGSTYDLNGGTLFCKRIENVNTGAATFTFNGGTLKPVLSVGNFMEKKSSMTFKVGIKGGTIDMNGLSNTINTDFVSGVAGGETDGGLTFTGKGRVILNGLLGYTGATTIADGVVYVKPGATFKGGLTIGAKGTLAVDMSGAITAETAVGTKIALFTAPKIAFEAENDTLAASVFLTGPAVGYTLSEEDGTVFATVTDVAKVAQTRKVTAYVATDNYIDQDGAWNNAKPNAYSVCVFNADAIMHIWGNNKGTINNIRFETLAIRGCRAKVMFGNDNYPDLEASRVTGNGTLVIARAGVAGKNGIPTTVDASVTIEVTSDGVAADRDAWIGWNVADNTTQTIINGDVYTKNGFLAIYTGVTFNGDVTINLYSRASYIGGSATEVAFNGALVLENGATFDCANKKLVLGENFRLVLRGGTLTNVNEESAAALAAAEVVMEAGTYTYGAFPGGVTEVTVTGGTILVAPPAEGDGKDFTLAGITLAEGVDADTVFQMGNTEYSWSFKVDEASGVLVAVAGPALDPSVPNRWIGGASGLYNVKANWLRGIPTMDQTVEFDNDAVVYHNYKGDVFLEIGKLVLNGHRVSFEILNHDKQYWGAVRIGSFDENEEGTLGLWRTGVWTRKGEEGNVQRLDWPATMKLEVGGTGTDCWLRDDWGDQYVRCPVEILESTTTLNLDYNVHLLGGVSGPGYVTARNRTDRNGGCRLIGGDWSAFTGTYKGHVEDRTRFATDFTGSAKAHWNFPQYIRLDAMEGTVTFGSIESTDDRHIEVQKDSTLVLEVGGRNTDFTIAPGVCFYENSTPEWKDGFWTQGSPTVTIKKVGTGTLTAGLAAQATLEAAEGAVVVNATDDALALVVDEGATVAATAEVTIGSATFKPGAQLKLDSAVAADVHPIAVKAAVDVTGVKVVADAAVQDALAVQEEGDPTAYTLISSTAGVTGTPDGEIVVRCTDNTAYGWKAVAQDNALQLRRKYVKPGLFIIVK